jgi:lipopolysaccharide transport system ATP-binding protein
MSRWRSAPLPSDPVQPRAPALVAEGLAKRFDIYPNDRSRLFELLGNRTHHAERWALRGLDLVVERGEALGVIGSNGAGKSTLLRLLAGITQPSEGRLRVDGRVATLLDLGVGFQDTFTGRENVELACSLLGMTPERAAERLPDVIRFAELGEFIDHPVRTWSAGMNLRLGFAIAVHSDAEILLIDEVLAVGDQYFQRKCVRRIEEARRDGVTMVIASHDLHAVRSLCDRVLWLEDGRVRGVGPPREMIERYLEIDRARTGPVRPPPPVVVPGGAAEAPPPRRVLPLRPADTTEDDPRLRETLAQVCAPADAETMFRGNPGEVPRVVDGDRMLVDGTGEARITRVQILDTNGNERERFRTGEGVVIAATFRTTEPLVRPIFGVALFRSDGVYVYGPNTRFDGVLDGDWHGVHTVFLHYPKLPLLSGHYRVSVAIFDSGHVKPHVWHNQLYDLEVAQDVEDHGIVLIPHRWGMLTWFDGRDEG